MSKRIVILGAGITGLSAAWKLLKLGVDAEITLLEKDREPGGLARSIQWRGHALDLGPHRFHTEIPEIERFVTDFCESRMVTIQRASRMYLNGRFIPYPIKPLPTLSALGPARSIAFGLSALKTLLPSGRKADSYEEYVIGYYGDRLYRTLFEPLARKVWGLDPNRLAAETARVRLRGDTIWQTLLDGLFSRQQTYVAEFLYPRNGIGEIAQQFAEEIAAMGGRIRFNSEVAAIQCEEEHVEVCGQIENDAVHSSLPKIASVTTTDGEVYPLDRLITTLPLPNTVEIFDPLPPAAIMDAASSLRFRAIVLLYLLYDESLTFEDNWLYFPESHIPFSRIYLPGNFQPKKGGRKQTCLCVEFTCEHGDETWQAQTSALTAQADEVLRECRLVNRSPMDAMTVRIEQGYPIYHTGYERSLNAVLGWLSRRRNCLTVGRQGLFRHNNLDQAIQMGLLAAEETALDKSDCMDWYNRVDRFKDYRIVD